MREGAPADAGRTRARSDLQASAEATDEALMSAYAGGDAIAFDVLYERHKGALYRYYRRQLSDAEASDCFQALWEKLISNRDRYRPHGAFRSYLFTIAHNILMDHYRKQKRFAEDADTDPEALVSDVPGPEGVHLRSQLRERLHALIRALPAHQREVWLLRQETDFSAADIARVTGTSEEGVKSRLRYARDKLKQGMARYAG